VHSRKHAKPENFSTHVTEDVQEGGDYKMRYFSRISIVPSSVESAHGSRSVWLLTVICQRSVAPAPRS